MADVEPPPADTSQTTSNSASMAADGNKPWERPWTVEEMRKEATNWSLSGDAGLLLYLKDFSQKMISRVHEIEKEVDGLMHDSKMTGVRANNVFNDFIMLANTQFVENRVYDEDVSQEETAKAGEGNDEKEKTKEQRESELIPKVKEALELGINVIDQAFEQLDSHVADSDSEEEETGYRADPLLEAKDPYINRLLPLMIGTPKFMEDDSVGLAEEESEEEESDHGSLSESESEKEEEEEEKTESSEESSESGEESSSEKPVKNQYSQESESEGSDLFGEEDEKESVSGSDEEEEEEPTPKKPSAPMDFASELAKKLGAPGSTPAQESDEEGEPVKESKETKPKEKKKREKKESTSSSKTKSKKKGKIEEEPFPAEEEDDSPFGNKGGLFSGTSKGLFDDSEEEGDLFTQSVSEKKTSKKTIESDKEEEEEKPKERKKSTSSKKPKGGVPMFGEDDEDDMFNEKKTTEKKKPSSVAPSGEGGLFDNEDEDDDLFSSAAPKATTEKPKKKEIVGGGGLFDEEEEEEDLFSENKKEEPKKEDTAPPVKQENKKKLPPGAVPMFGGGGGNPLAAAIKKQRKQESDEEDNEWSEEEKPRTASVKSSQSVTSINSASKVIGVSNASKPSPSPSSNSLFDDEGDDNALFAAPAKPRADSKSKTKPTKSLFDDDDGDLFSSKPTKKTAEKKTQPSGGLFDDEEDDLFAKPKDSGKKKPVGGVALFGDDILPKKDKPVEKETEKKVEPAKTSKPAKKTVSLFDEEEEEEEGDIFGAPSSKTAPPRPTGASKAKDLFTDGNDMFGEEESPGVDIFNQQKTAPKMNKDSAVPVAKSSAPNLFDEDDVGLFGTTQTTKTDSVDVGGVTTEESTDTPDKTKETKPRKPVGGVSMFGAFDPSAALKNKGKKEKEVKDKTPPPKGDSEEEDTSDKPEPPPLDEPKTEETTKSADPLFGGEDDENGDLFGSSQKSEPEEKEEAKPRKPIGGMSMFGAFDPSAALKNKEKKEKEVKDETPPPNEVKDGNLPPEKVKESEDEDRIEPPPLDLPEPSKKTKAVDPLFGDYEDDDLFKVSPVKNISTAGPSKPSTTPKPIIPSKSKNSKPETSKKANLFGSPKSDEDDLFSSSAKPPFKEPPTSPLGQSPRKPAGGVSMFGGVDPFGVSKKSDLSPGSPTTGEGDKKPEAVSPVSVGKKMPGKIGKLQMNLGINPAAMLPGATPPIKEPEVVAVGFDTPAQANTLHSANKSRAKIQAKRRPPSRKGRQGGGPGGDSAPSEASPSPQVETPPVESRVPQPTSDLFGNDDLLGEEDTKNDFMAPPPVPDSYEEENNDLFSSTRKKNTIMSDEDLFNPVISSTSKPKNVINSMNDDDGDDIFGSSSTVKTTSKFVSKRKVENDTKDALVNGVEDVLSDKTQTSKVIEPEDEDLFAAKPKVKKQTDFEKLLDDKPEETKTESKPSLEEDLFPDSTQNKKPESKPKMPEAADDDIFADSSLNKKASKAKTEEKNVNEDDELFGKPTQKGKKPSKARPKTKDEDLFKDNTDIFADVPAAKPREKKKKKATEKKSVFKDDDDDIFATTPSKPKAKKEKKTEAPKKTATDVTDIFDDPLS
ncbi:WASH complex subunit 2-like isoform X2 [Saccostrea echinata]|uniref:WASH complex subunit 2-like isoform X2 n=1 Tax=Saccostrea echinata TaxID=191078 RepID=UPI002A81D265|nr:WASH complex subunit 2-like isoform X2 [Saccostrea echinata]